MPATMGRAMLQSGAVMAWGGIKHDWQHLAAITLLDHLPGQAGGTTTLSRRVFVQERHLITVCVWIGRRETITKQHPNPRKYPNLVSRSRQRITRVVKANIVIAFS